ncbi:MAG: PBSX family phage terminase large subunit [Bacteroidales bacterium]|nr:PBSX family phage terminase large subunit [Bacteroidales bacterium]
MGEIQTTKIYQYLADAVEQGYTVISEQGGARSSKTYNTVIFLIIYLLQHPRTRLSIVRATLPALKGSVYRDFKEIMIRMGVWHNKALNKSDFVYTFENGSEVEFFSVDNEQKLRGRKRDVLFVNEANEITFTEWKQLKMRTTKFAVVDYNPSFGDEHWLCALNEEDGTYHFITTYKDNPFLEETIIKEIEGYKDTNASLWRVYGAGLQAVIEGAIYPEYDIVDELPQSRRRWIGVDFGFTNDPTAIVEVRECGKELYVDEIAYERELLAVDIAERLRPYKGMRIICDSADPRLIEELYRVGLDVHGVKKYSGSVMAGISKVKEYRLKVTRRSANIIKELKNYTFRQDKNGHWLNEPIDAYNHACDAFRYVVLSEILGQGDASEISRRNYNALRNLIRY